MKYFFDTEFIEKPQKIDLISIGIVAEDGRELYLINRDCRTYEADDWVKENVLSKMPEYKSDINLGFYRDASIELIPNHVLTKEQIKNKILEFIGADNNPEFWAYYADCDWVVICWLFGRMIDLPKHFPYYCKDLQQEIDEGEINKDELLEDVPQNNIHNALDDARWVRNAYEYLSGVEIEWHDV